METVLVTDGRERAALSIVRSLGRAGYHCVVGSATPGSLAGASRHAAAEVILPEPGADPQGHAQAVADAVRAYSVDVVIPVSEASVLAVLNARDRIDAVVPFPDLERFQAVCDKARVLEVASSLGIAVPEQHTIVCAGDAVVSRLQYPVVLKPARSIYTDVDGTRGKVTVRRADDAAQAAAALLDYPAAAFPILAQQVIDGPGIGLFLLLDAGGVRARFAHRRLREKPPSGGVSVVRESAPMDPDLLERSVRLLDAFGWQGVAMVEYKLDAANGRPYLMEINGRFWGSLQLAVDAGVDFPTLLVRAALGEPVDPVLSYGFVRSRWFWGDVDNLIAQWRSSDSSALDRIRAMLAWLRAFGPGYTGEVLRVRDPRPFLAESREWFKAIARS